MFDSGGLGKKRKTEEVDLDITPMIDVTFLLLIFFMVTSTMQATPDKDIPPAMSGENQNMAGKVDITIRSAIGGAEGDIELDGRIVTLEQLKADLMQMTSSGALAVMIFCERDVRNGALGEVEAIITEVAKDSEQDIPMAFAVRDR